tara:strand:- start:15747 stop:16271 length:525 start_codon:yes stop_codon:yes gene_type:complete
LRAGDTILPIIKTRTDLTRRARAVARIWSTGAYGLVTLVGEEIAEVIGFTFAVISTQTIADGATEPTAFAFAFVCVCTGCEAHSVRGISETTCAPFTCVVCETIGTCIPLLDSTRLETDLSAAQVGTLEIALAGACITCITDDTTIFSYAKLILARETCRAMLVKQAWNSTRPA